MSQLRMWAALNNIEGDLFTCGLPIGDVDSLARMGLTWITVVKMSAGWQYVNEQLSNDSDIIIKNYEVDKFVTLFKVMREAGLI